MVTRKKPAQAEAAASTQSAYKLAVNEARGEVRLMIDDVELVLAAEMGRLSALSNRLQCKSLADLFQRLTNIEVEATWAGVELLCIRGDVRKALGKLQLRHFPECGKVFAATLGHQFASQPAGNA